MKTSRKTALGSVLFAAAAAAFVFAPAASACPSCAATSSPKEPNVWPIVGAFMLVPWALAAGAVLLIRRESRSA